MNKKSAFFLLALAVIITSSVVMTADLFSYTQQTGNYINLLSIQEGTLPILVPPSYHGWTAECLLDDSPSSGWASEKGKVNDNRFVFELIASAEIESFEFDSAAIDSEGAGAKDVLVEISDTSPDMGYETVLRATLAPRADGQKFAAVKKVRGRFVRLTLLNNHGSAKYTELFSFRGYGVKPAVPSPLENVSGTYATNYKDFHVLQQGTALTGCYEYKEGILDGVIEGRLMKITWSETGEQSGPAVMVFAPDGQSFKGYWWYSGNERNVPNGSWTGKRASTEVGGCPHWAGSVGVELKKKLSSEGRARVYGILFVLDSAVIRPESRPVLEEMVSLLRSEPGWKLMIEGHTDSTGTAAYNQNLSEKRAAAVKDYLTAAGIPAERLQTVGYGATRPVADNATEAGRAQNRRVELVKQ
ncbi:MAG: OmpA family protein [Nitrososphaeria archaeon]